jgi:hypothetical protein
MSTRAEESPASLEREWWRRSVSVLVRPREVFEALRDDSREAVEARQEPLTAIVFLGGVSAFLSTSTAAHLFDNSGFDLVVLVMEAIVAGVLVGLQSFWLLGGALYLGERGVDGEGSYRQARHMVGLAMTPFVVALVTVWPVRLAVFGSDLFRSGGSDSGAGGDVFHGLDAVFLAWAVALLLLGVRTVNGWSWRRSVAALGVALVFVALLVALAVVL